jgi:hypothetical protein
MVNTVVQTSVTNRELEALHYGDAEGRARNLGEKAAGMMIHGNYASVVMAKWAFRMANAYLNSIEAEA